MRILVVSAHFPPNFVSGGTLVPQRTAVALQRRGHDVAVYAGWRGDLNGDDRPAMTSWDEVDADGLPVRWVVTTPWINGVDVRNYDNPDVALDFGRHLKRFRPDVVHFHSLQSLGVGVVHAAADAGARTVVTLHDFWWWCARHFLCDRDNRPCCLVVEAGVCQCAVDRDWLVRRQEVMDDARRRADRLVAVSATAAAVATANGAEPGRLVVIENGLPPSRATAAPVAAGGGTLRLTYAGGNHPVKGPGVLAAAARQLQALAGWRLACYGADEWRESFAGLPVEMRPAYPPSAVAEVMAATDVLVVPSLMRETYSVVTREAISHRVPVVCSDSLGPEEVVTDGHNGLVVPTGDAGALAGAIRRLVEDAALLPRLRRGCQALALPSLEGQVDATEALYGELISSGGAPATSAGGRAGPFRRAGAPPRRVLFVVGITGAPLRYRAWLPAAGLESLGVHVDVRHYRHPDVSGLADRADVVVMYRVPATVQVLHTIAGVQRKGIPVVFDVDDLIFDPDVADEIPALRILPPAEAEQWMDGVRRYRTTMEACDAFVGSTEPLVDHARTLVGLPSFRFANGVGHLVGQLSDEALRRPRSPGPPRIAYLSGTITHDHDWRHVEGAVIDALSRHREAELWLVGPVRTGPAIESLGDRVVRRPLLPWPELPALLRDVDVNLAPLEPGSRFNEAKSAVKWLEAALTETATIASPTAPFREVIDDGESGRLADEPAAWAEAIDELLASPDRRAVLARRARRTALLRLAPAVQAHRYLDLVGQFTVLDPRPATSWPPLTTDEPFVPIDLDRYEIPPPPDALPPPPPPEAVTWRLRVVDLYRAYRREGWRVVGRRGYAFARRRVDARRRRATNP